MLVLLPDDRVVEHVEVIHVELAVEPQRLTHVQRQRSTFRYHHQNRCKSHQPFLRHTKWALRQRKTPPNPSLTFFNSSAGKLTHK